MKHINFYSLCRSGHHAIIFWVINNLGGFNESFKDIFFINQANGLYFYNNVSVKTEAMVQKVYDPTFQHAVNYNWLFKNYEDVAFELAANNVVIARDFLNLICSRYKKWGNALGWDSRYCITDINGLISSWKQHLQHHDKSNFISYNMWVKSKEYRDTVSSNLGIANSVDNTEYVPTLAEGSSFLGTQKETSCEKYEQRYKQVTLPDMFVEAILKDSELLALNREIFGIDIPTVL
jgi:hypothetical protein